MGNNIYLQITKKTADEMGIKKLDKIDIYQSAINMWHASLKYINRKKCILFMNDLTRYSIFLYGVKKKDLKFIDNIFLDSLIDTMRSDNIPHESIMKLVDNIESFNIIKTNNRSITGSINDHYRCLPAYLDLTYVDRMAKEGILNLRKINHQLNRIPLMCSQKGFYAVDKMKELLIDGYDPDKDENRRDDW
ncbi:MAG: hypothetical protein JEY91_13155 [Spirochaetaceae bacterium]|nr:hypothetical protein [Spirochaetaceae bacterium]